MSKITQAQYSYEIVEGKLGRSYHFINRDNKEEVIKLSYMPISYGIENVPQSKSNYLEGTILYRQSIGKTDKEIKTKEILVKDQYNNVLYNVFVTEDEYNNTVDNIISHYNECDILGDMEITEI